jgi:hypothetical protein
MNVYAVPRIKLGLMIDVYLDAMMRLMSVTINSKIFREDKIFEESPLFIACDFYLRSFKISRGKTKVKSMKHGVLTRSLKIFEELKDFPASCNFFGIL